MVERTCVRRCSLLASNCLLLVIANSAIAQSPANRIFDRTIAPQPFEKTPFRQVRIPDWVHDTIGCGYTLSAMDTAARERAVKHGVTISEMGFVDPFYAYYDSKLLERRSPHVPLERLPKDIAEYKRLGVRILGVYPPCLQGEVYEKHPDWRRIATNTTEIPNVDLKQHPYGGMLCLLGPYGDFFIDVLAEIVTKFPDVDAFSFDGLHYGGVCYCEHCRAAYRAEMKSEIPNADLHLPEFRRYQHWADRRMEDLIQRMQTRLKGIKPEIALVTWTTNAGRFGHFLSVPRNMPSRMNLLLDAPDQEFWLDETNRGATVVPALANAYIWATTNHRVAFSEPYLMSHGNPYGKDSFPPHEVLRRMLLAVTYGAQPSLAVAQPKHLQEAAYKCLDEIQRRKEWLTHKEPERWGAILLSDNTRNFYGRNSGQVEQRYLAAVLGFFRTGVEEHLPLTIINDWNLNAEDLAKYKVLMLPNAACLDEAQVGAIDAYVKNGGGLVASLDTSLCNEFGDPREDFALKNVLGLSYRGLPPAKAAEAPLDVNFAKVLAPDYWEKRKGVFEFRYARDSFLRSSKVDEYLGEEPVTFKGPAVRVAPLADDIKTVATLRIPADKPDSELPAILTRQHGQGRVVYFAGGLDAAYYLYAYPYQRLMLKQAIEHAASEPAPVRVEAQMCVHATLMRQTKGDAKRLVLHLFNDVNTTAFHALPNDDVPLREETIPIRDIRVTFSPTYRFKGVKVQPEGVELKIDRGDIGSKVIIPQLDVHSMVVAELE